MPDTKHPDDSLPKWATDVAKEIVVRQLLRLAFDLEASRTNQSFDHVARLFSESCHQALEKANLPGDVDRVGACRLHAGGVIDRIVASAAAPTKASQ